MNNTFCRYLPSLLKHSLLSLSQQQAKFSQHQCRYFRTTFPCWSNVLASNQNNKHAPLHKRPPVVTIMGHVDHGKTTLLDHLRNSKIVQQEFGGITQHIGAFVVPFKQGDKTELVTFLDTPGHAAFAAMRQRGADVTDIVVLVIACEDGVLDQTEESIKYAKNSQVPIIVAVNKIDKFPNKEELVKRIANIRFQLKAHDVICEEDGGDVQLVKISALHGLGVEDLKEAILALAETLSLTANIENNASGRIIESRVDVGKGKICTALVQEGYLRKGDYIIAGQTNWARVRLLYDERGGSRTSCLPGLPIQITGWREDKLPSAGDPFIQVENEATAKSTIREFQRLEKIQQSEEQAAAWAKKYEELHKVYHEKMKERRAKGIYYGRSHLFDEQRGKRQKESAVDEEKKARTLSVILKCDVDGSLDALLSILDTYDRNNDRDVKLDLVKHGVGPITENDLMMAETVSNPVIYGFNVKLINQKIFNQAKKAQIDLKLFSVIYHLIDDIKSRIEEKMPYYEKEVLIGRAFVIQEYIVKDGRLKIHVAGCRCSKGNLLKEALYKLERNNEVVIKDMHVRTMKHLKDDAKKIDNDMECGISFLESESLQFEPGDVLICYEKQKLKSKLKWDIKGFN